MRQLSQIESAYSEMNNKYPITLVCVIRLRKGPSYESLRTALDKIQLIHPLLTAIIKEKRNKFWFEKDPVENPITLELVHRKHATHWKDIARKEVNIGFDHSFSPLMRGTYLTSINKLCESEIVLSFHHALIDAMSLVPLIDRLLIVANDINNDIDSTLQNLKLIALAPTLNKVLPASFKGANLISKMVPFLFRQLREERKYKESTLMVKDTPISGVVENDFMTISFSKEETSSLVKWTRKNKTTLSNAISAVMLTVVNKVNYGGEKTLFRAMFLANLRPYLNLKQDNGKAGCFATMMRYNIEISPEKDITDIAKRLGELFSESAKRGEKYLFAIMGHRMVKKMIRAHDDRVATTALSYAGPINLKQNYGNIEVEGIHAIISNNSLGAELSGFGKICFGKLSLDLNYLIEEINEKKANTIREEIKQRLLNLTRVE